MADTPPTGETVNQGDSKTAVTPPATPPVEDKTPEPNAVTELQKQLDKERMEKAALRNKLEAEEKAKAEKEAQELEEQNKFKELHEQEKAKREALEAEIAEKEKQSELKKAKDQVLADYSDEVKTLAEEVGLDLTDTDDVSVSTFKEKLDKINTRVEKSNVSSNNPKIEDMKFELSGEELQRALQDTDSFHDIVVSKYPGIAAMTGPRKK